MSWVFINTVLIYISKDFKYTPNIASFNFNGTFIKNKEDKYKRRITDGDIKKKLLMIHEKGGSLVVFSNQKDNDIDIIKEMFNEFIEKINFPFIALFATKDNCFYKPFTNMWRILQILYKKRNSFIDLSKSIYIGYNAGRIKQGNLTYNKYDYDRSFAYNSKIKFCTTENFFLDIQDIQKWTWVNTFMTPKIKKMEFEKSQQLSEPNIIKELRKLPKSKSYMIILVGFPTSGKSIIGIKIVKQWNISEFKNNTIEILNDNITNNINQTKKYLNDNKSIIIDDTNPSNSIRMEYIEIAETYNTPVLIIDIQTNRRISQLFNCIKIQKANTHNIYKNPNDVYNQYKKTYEKPRHNLPNVHVIEYNIVLKDYPEFWFQY